MLQSFFYWSGVAAWVMAGPVLLVAVLFVLSYWVHDTVRPSLGNLRFALLGKPRSDRRSYYEIWCGMYRWHYRHYTRGAGSRNFARCALRRLLREARRETQKGTGR